MHLSTRRVGKEKYLEIFCPKENKFCLSQKYLSGLNLLMELIRKTKISKTNECNKLKIIGNQAYKLQHKTRLTLIIIWMLLTLT